MLCYFVAMPLALPSAFPISLNKLTGFSCFRSSVQVVTVKESRLVVSSFFGRKMFDHRYSVSLTERPIWVSLLWWGGGIVFIILHNSYFWKFYILFMWNYLTYFKNWIPWVDRMFNIRLYTMQYNFIECIQFYTLSYCILTNVNLQYEKLNAFILS